MQRFFAWLLSHARSFPKLETSQFFALFFALLATGFTGAQLSMFIIDRANQFRTVVYSKLIESSFDINEKSHRLCHKIGVSSLAILQGNSVDIEEIDTRWEEFLTSGDDFALVASRDLIVAYQRFSEDMLISKQGLSELNLKVRQPIRPKADFATGDLEYVCLKNVVKFLRNVRAIEGVGNLSDKVSSRFGEPPPEFFGASNIDEIFERYKKDATTRKYNKYK